MQYDTSIKAVLFDFGGVLAEEGFREGLMTIGRNHGLDPDEFFNTAADLAYDSGYVIGTDHESSYWSSLRERTGIRGSDKDLRNELLDRFVLREWMIDLVRKVRDEVGLTAILSDQTNWLDELNHRDGFFEEFHHVFNSYHIGKGKKDQSLFTDVLRRLDLKPAETVFIDDNEGHIQRARAEGLHAILYTDKDDLISKLKALGLLGG